MKKVNNFFLKKKERKKKRITCEEDRLGAAQRRTNGRDSRSSRREKRKQVKIGNLKCLWKIVAMYSDSLNLETKGLALDVIISNRLGIAIFREMQAPQQMISQHVRSPLYQVVEGPLVASSYFGASRRSW